MVWCSFDFICLSLHMQHATCPIPRCTCGGGLHQPIRGRWVAATSGPETLEHQRLDAGRVDLAPRDPNGWATMTYLVLMGWCFFNFLETLSRTLGVEWDYGATSCLVPLNRRSDTYWHATSRTSTKQAVSESKQRIHLSNDHPRSFKCGFFWLQFTEWLRYQAARSETQLHPSNLRVVHFAQECVNELRPPFIHYHPLT